MKKNTITGGALLALVVFLLLSGILLLGHFGLLTDKRLGLDENPYLAVVVLQLLIYAVPALFYCRIRGAAFRDSLRLSFTGPGQLLFILYAAVFLIAGSALASVGMYSLFPGAYAAGGVETYTAFARNAGIFDGLYLVLAFAILPAVTEEFLRRGEADVTVLVADATCLRRNLHLAVQLRCRTPLFASLFKCRQIQHYRLARLGTNSESVC